MTQHQYPNLSRLTNHSLDVYASLGTEAQAEAIAKRRERAYVFLRGVLNRKAKVAILILAPEHWQEYTGSPMYGIPQTIDKQIMVVAGQNSELWAMIVPPLADLPEPAAQGMQLVYGQADGSIDLAAYI